MFQLKVMQLHICQKCGAYLLGAIAVCHCALARHEQPDVEPMPLSPQIVEPVHAITTATASYTGIPFTPYKTG
jgi:hypothetical protein